jgi:tRNA (guanine10-N2)-dimethyltransferase
VDELLAICTRMPGNELAAVECQNLTGGAPDAQGVAVCQRLDLIPRAAFISLGLHCIARAVSCEELIRQIARRRLAADRFRIDVLRLTPCIPIIDREVVIQAANSLDGAPDLSNPAHRFLIISQEECLWFGEILAVAQRDYRQHDSKPFHTTSSLPSRLARALVNLVAPPTQAILDPFCGTGSILLEASAIGLASYGLDKNIKMTGMSRLNLAHFSYPVQVGWGDALECQQKVGAIVTDLPYGRILKIDRQSLLAILKHLANLAPVAIYLAEESISDLLVEAGYQRIEVYKVRKTHALTRYVHRAISKGNHM